MGVTEYLKKKVQESNERRAKDKEVRSAAQKAYDDEYQSARGEAYKQQAVSSARAQARAEAKQYFARPARGSKLAGVRSALDKAGKYAEQIPAVREMYGMPARERRPRTRKKKKKKQRRRPSTSRRDTGPQWGVSWF